PTASWRTPSPTGKAAGHPARIAGPADDGPAASPARADPAVRRTWSAGRTARPARSARPAQTARRADPAARPAARRAGGPGAAGSGAGAAGTAGPAALLKWGRRRR